MSVKASKARYAACLADCEELIKKVELKNKINFKNFAEAWQEMTFSLIFCGRNTEDELLSFSEDLIQAAKSLWLPPTPAKQRLIAGYLMYGIYFKQPLRHMVKIKVTRDEWVHIAHYYQFTCQHQVHESYYMFCRLIEDDAFSFAATAHEVPLDSNNTLPPTILSRNMEEVTQFEHGMLELVSSGILEDIAAIDDQYESGTKQLKEALGGDKLPDLTKKELAQSLRDLCSESTLEHGAEATQKEQQQASRPSSRFSSKSIDSDNARESLATSDAPHNSPGDLLKWCESGSTSSIELKYDSDSSTIESHSINSEALGGQKMPDLTKKELSQSLRVAPHNSPGDLLKWCESGSNSSIELKYDSDSSTIESHSINLGTSSNLSMPEL